MSGQSAQPPPPKRRRGDAYEEPSSQLDEASSRQQTGPSSSTDWPIKRKCRNIIYSTRGVHDWSDISKVKLEEDADAVLKYYNIKASSFDVVLEDPRCVLQTDVGATLSIACRDDISDDLADRARVLCNVAGQIPHITSNTKVKFIEPPSRDGIYPTGRSDSDDEEIPDLPVVAAFTENEKVLLTSSLKKTHFYYQSCIRYGYYNNQGKNFINWLVEMIKLLDSTAEECQSHISTGGPSLCQPGSFDVTWELEGSRTRSGRSERVDTGGVADHIYYVPSSKLHVLVNEVKKDKDQPVESQHNMQMVGLFSKVQRTMLGLEVKPGRIHPKILLRGDEVLYNIDTGCSFDVSKTSDLLRLIDCLIFFMFYAKVEI